MLKKYQVRVRRNDIRYSYGFCKTLEEMRKKTEKIEFRLDKEDSDGHIIGSLGEVLKTRFKSKGVLFEIIGTESTGKKTIDAVDYVKNIKNKKISEMPRISLYNLTRSE